MSDEPAVDPGAAVLLDKQPQEPEAPADDPLDAVIVVKTTGADGAIATDVIVNGNVQPTEAQTLLELGIQSWRRKIGLSKE